MHLNAVVFAGSLDVRGDGHGANGASSQVDVAWPQLGSTRLATLLRLPQKLLQISFRLPSDFRLPGAGPWLFHCTLQESLLLCPKSPHLGNQHQSALSNSDVQERLVAKPDSSPEPPKMSCIASSEAGGLACASSRSRSQASGLVGSWVPKRFWSLWGGFLNVDFMKRKFIPAAAV